MNSDTILVTNKVRTDERSSVVKLTIKQNEGETSYVTNGDAYFTRKHNPDSTNGEQYTYMRYNVEYCPLLPILTELVINYINLKGPGNKHSSKLTSILELTYTIELTHYKEALKELGLKIVIIQPCEFKEDEGFVYSEGIEVIIQQIK